MNKVELFLSGQMETAVFYHDLKADDELKAFISGIIPKEARFNPDHPLWKDYSYLNALEHDFDVLKILSVFKFNNEIGDQLNIVGTLHHLYTHKSHKAALSPDDPLDRRMIECEELFGLYLDLIQDTFDGPEVRDTVERILQTVKGVEGKTKRKSVGKCMVAEAFHYVDRKRPRWIQGPEWPAGSDGKPMRFIKQFSKSKAAYAISLYTVYLFEDVNTGEQRSVEQFT